jgi:hypothetical protein
MEGVSSGAAESSIRREPHQRRLPHGDPGQRPVVGSLRRLSDPRQHAKVLYPLPEILLLVLSATIAGADDFVETTLWGAEHLAFLRRFYRYESGIPSHDTLCDVFAALDPELFKACFLAWVSGLRDDDPDIIAIDGKTSRRSHDKRKGRNPLHLVSAWAARQRIVLGQRRPRRSPTKSPPFRCC